MKLKEYIADIYNELMHKVTWPTWKEIQSSALLVLVASIIFAVLVWGMDSGFAQVMKAIYG